MTEVSSLFAPARTYRQQTLPRPGLEADEVSFFSPGERGQVVAGTVDEVLVLDLDRGKPVGKPIRQSANDFELGAGVAYLTARTGEGERVMAYDVESGRELWRSQPVVYSSFLELLPQGQLLLFDDDDKLVALDPEDGHEKWRADVSCPEFTAGLEFLPDGKHAIAVGGNHVSKLDLDTGQVLWKSTPEDSPAAMQCFPKHGLDSQGNLYVVRQDRALKTSLEVLGPDGRVLQKHPVQGGSELAVWKDGDCAFVSQFDYDREAHQGKGTLERIDANGITTWWKGTDKLYLLGVSDDGVLAMAHDSILEGLDLRTGRNVWHEEIQGMDGLWDKFKMRPDGTVYVQHGEQCVIVRPEKHPGGSYTVRRSDYTAPAELQSVQLGSDGGAFLLDQDGDLYHIASRRPAPHVPGATIEKIDEHTLQVGGIRLGIRHE